MRLACAPSEAFSKNKKIIVGLDVKIEILRRWFSSEARKAKANGSTRFCMGAAWRDLHGRKNGFKKILQMVREVRSVINCLSHSLTQRARPHLIPDGACGEQKNSAMDMEVCTTLGMLSAEQAEQLKEAGLTAYNHNLDTSREFYPEVITTRSYDDRLGTLANVRAAGLSVCSGGIIGLGEAPEDRVGLVHEMSQLPSPPESFPVNALVPIPGTPLGERERVSFHDILRIIATARIVLPTSVPFSPFLDSL